MLSGLLNRNRQENPALELVEDPVCGMEVDPEKSCRTELCGKTYYFCKASCKASFKKTYFKRANASAEVRKAPRKGSACCG